MNKFSYGLLALLMVALASSKLLHQQTTLQEQNVNYYEALLAKESDLRVTLAQIQSSIQYFNKTLGQVQNNTDLQIVALSDAMADERYLLSQIQQTHVLPLGLKSTNCTNISSQDLDQIRITIQQIRADLVALNTSINELESSVVTPDNYTSTCIYNLRIQRLWAENYLKTLEDSLVQCPTPLPSANVTSIGIGNVTNYANISNLNTANWVYGNISQA